MYKTLKHKAFLRRATAPVLSAFIFGAALVPTAAHASRNLALSYDARSVGMGGTGVASATPSAGVVFNPALIGGTRRVSATVTFSPIVQRIQAPFINAAGTAPAEFYSDTGFGPLGQVGVSARVHDRLTVGAQVQIPEALNGQYSKLPSVDLLPKASLNAQTLSLEGSLKRQLFIATVSLPLAVEVTDWLTVAGAYRMSFYEDRQTATLAGQTLLNAKASGKNFTGADVGLLVKLHPLVQLGLSYQTQTKTDLKASMVQGGVASPTVAQHDAFVVPHRMRAGLAVRPMGTKLLAAADFSWALDHTGDKQLRDSFVGNLGLEYLAAAHVPVRLGATVGRTATQPKRTSAGDLPSGAAWGVSSGAGYRFNHFDLDGAFAYVRVGGDDNSAALPGAYISQEYVISLAATYHL